MTERTTNRFTTQWRSALPDDPNDSSRHKVHAIAHNVITTLVNTAGVIDLITYLTHWGQHLLASDSAEVEKYNLNVRRRVLTGLPEPSFQ
jgi:hypothetical protein